MVESRSVAGKMLWWIMAAVLAAILSQSVAISLGTFEPKLESWDHLSSRRGVPGLIRDHVGSKGEKLYSAQHSLGKGIGVTRWRILREPSHFVGDGWDIDVLAAGIPFHSAYCGEVDRQTIVNRRDGISTWHNQSVVPTVYFGLPRSPTSPRRYAILPLWLGLLGNVIVYLATFMLLRYAWMQRRFSRRRRRRQCTRCAYPISGNQVCPECGAQPAGA